MKVTVKPKMKRMKGKYSVMDDGGRVTYHTIPGNFEIKLKPKIVCLTVKHADKLFSGEKT